MCALGVATPTSYPVDALTERIIGREKGNMKSGGLIQVRYHKNSKPETVLNSVFKQLGGAGIKFKYSIPEGGTIFLGSSVKCLTWFEADGVFDSVRLCVVGKKEDWYTELDGLLDKACLGDSLRRQVVDHFKKFKPEE